MENFIQWRICWQSNLSRRLLKEAENEGESGLKRTLGPLNLITLGIGAIIGAGIFVLTGQAAANHAGPAVVLSFVRGGYHVRVCGALLCGVRFADSDCGLGVHVWVCDAGRVCGVDHRVGPGAGVCVRRGDGGFGLERILCWTVCRTSGSTFRRS